MNKLSIAVAVTMILAGCDFSPQRETYQGYADAPLTPSGIQFDDDAQTNTDLPENLYELMFLDARQNKVELSDFLGKRNVVLVFMRGFSGFVCPFCSAQSSRLIANYEEFQNRNAEVLLVYPGQRHTVDDFLAAIQKEDQANLDRVPFPILLDENLEAVNFLQIAADLALPATFILDKQGKVRFAYVGQAPNDRPSINAMLTHLDQILLTEPSDSVVPEPARTDSASPEKSE